MKVLTRSLYQLQMTWLCRGRGIPWQLYTWNLSTVAMPMDCLKGSWLISSLWGKQKDPSGRLFAQFHAPQTKRMKKSIISEIKEENSRIRVLLATSALGMGVNAPYVEHIIHISPPSNLESYMQEIGRAGRTGKPACATLFYNNSDIASNKVHVQEQMKDYCRSEDSCLRTLILKYAIDILTSKARLFEQTFPAFLLTKAPRHGFRRQNNIYMVQQNPHLYQSLLTGVDCRIVLSADLFP